MNSGRKRVGRQRIGEIQATLSRIQLSWFFEEIFARREAEDRIVLAIGTAQIEAGDLCS